MMRWYVVNTHAHSEAKANFNLRQQGFDTYLPKYRKWRRHARRREQVLAPLFPRYLFVHIDMATQGWRVIQSSIGVSHIVCQGGNPAPVPNGVIESIKHREDEDNVVKLDAERLFVKGDRLSIMEGPFRDQVGLFDSSSDDHRVTVLLKLLGRQLRVELPVEAVAAYA